MYVICTKNLGAFWSFKMRKIAAVLAVSLLALGSTSIYAQGVSEQQYQQMLQRDSAERGL